MSDGSTLTSSLSIDSTASKRKSSYGDILRASALLGGSQGVLLLISMVQTKCVACFLGPLGIGLSANYQAILNLSGRMTNLGLAGSSIRNIAGHVESGDTRQLVEAMRNHFIQSSHASLG